jgi:hypothetical protein
MKNAVYSFIAMAAVAQAGVSTVYETEVQTITSCEAYVTDCPARHSTIVHTYTSTCDEDNTKPYPTNTPEYPTKVYTSAETTKAYSVSTVYETMEYTITSCAPTVTYCPVGHVTTTVKESTTLCPVTETHVPYPYPPKGNETYYHAPPPAETPYTTNGNSGYPSSPVSMPVYSTVTYETCVPTVITKVITVTAEGPKTDYPVSSEAPKPSYPAESPAGCPGGYNCPAETTPYGTGAPVPTGAYTTKPVDFTGSASTQRAGGLFLAVGLAAIALF